MRNVKINEAETIFEPFYEVQYGQIGLAEFPWLIFHYTGRLFRLGRLQFQLLPAKGHIPSGEFVMETHIPQGESLDMAACRVSFAMAVEFFGKYFPKYPAACFSCESWLLNPNLSDILPEESNIVRFMKLWTVCEVLEDNSAQAMERVFGFGFDRGELLSAPEKTGLQRALKKYLLAGGQINMCEGYFPAPCIYKLD